MTIDVEGHRYRPDRAQRGFRRKRIGSREGGKRELVQCSCAWSYHIIEDVKLPGCSGIGSYSHRKARLKPEAPMRCGLGGTPAKL